MLPIKTARQLLYIIISITALKNVTTSAAGASLRLKQDIWFCKNHKSSFNFS